MTDGNVYAAPRQIDDVRDCYFYHTMEIPGHGLVQGEWDLRKGAGDYLGGVDLRGKRVLEIGTASGFLCFHMEAEGAEVVAYDLSHEQSWDIVPYAGIDFDQYVRDRKEHIRKLNNGWWFTHRRLSSKARVVYGSVYSVPEAIGPVDISVFGSVLLHVRDPFFALQNALRLTRETVVVTEAVPRPFPLLNAVRPLTGDTMRFLPDFKRSLPYETWWKLSPQIVVRFVGVLGFKNVEIKYHFQEFAGRMRRMFTVVGHRTTQWPVKAGSRDVIRR